MDANLGNSANDSNLKISKPCSSETSPNNAKENSAKVRESDKNQERSTAETKTKIIFGKKAIDI